jgi:hypothetical protein
VLMAHYDSVPHSPGAGDDGSGVATLLESARVLVREPIARNRILLLFTDAEEMGLLGAEGFFADHPLVSDIRAVINLEGSGSNGPSLLLRSSVHAGHLLAAVRDTATAPIAISYAQEVFARMPNDTDFTVPDRYGIASIDFAFAGERNHYHTMLDTVDNLDPRTLQHHGSYALPLARQLAATDLNVTAPNFSYLTVQQLFWISWPIGWTLFLALGGVAGLLIASVRTSATPLQILISFGLCLLVLTLSVLTCYTAFWLADWLIGTTVDFPANPWPWRLLMAAGALLPVMLLGYVLRDRLDFWAVYLGCWWLLGFLALALAIYAPLAANVLIIPLLIASVLALLAMYALDEHSQRLQILVGIGAAAVLAHPMLSMAYAMESSQGLRLAPAIYAGLALLTPALLPFRVNGKLLGAVALTLAVGLIWTPFATLYSEWRPQLLSLYYVLDQDQGTARWAAIGNNPIPDRLIDAFGSEPNNQSIVPWSTTQQFPTFPAPAVSIQKPHVQVQRAGQEVELSYRSTTGGDYVQLVLPETAGVSDLVIEGQAVDPVARNGFIQARLFANGSDTVTFRFQVTSPDPISGYLIDGSHSLPDIAQPYSDARGKLAMPQHQGDQRLAFTRVHF